MVPAEDVWNNCAQEMSVGCREIDKGRQHTKEIELWDEMKHRLGPRRSLIEGDKVKRNVRNRNNLTGISPRL